MASGGAGAGPPIDPAKNYIYKIENIPYDITPGKTYKLNDTLVTCLVDANTMKKYLKITFDKIIELDPTKHSIFYSNEPPPLIPSRPSKFVVHNSISVGLTDKNEYIYEVKLTPSDVHNFFKYEDTIVSYENIDGDFTLEGVDTKFSKRYTNQTVLSREFPNNITGLFAICSSVNTLTDTQQADALTFIEKNEPALLNTKNSAGETPLMIAIINSHWPIAAALITRGADLNIESNEKKTAANYSCDNKNKEFKGRKTVLGLLRTRGARVGSAAAAAAVAGEPAAEESSCTLQGGRRSQRTKNARKQTRRQRAKKNRKSRRTTRK